MYEYKNLLVNTAEDGITTVTINRPKALNALDTLTLEEMKDCFNRLACDKIRPHYRCRPQILCCWC